MRTALPFAVALALPLIGCSWLSPSPPCASADATLAAGTPPLTCAETLPVLEYAGQVAGRPITGVDRNVILWDLKARYSSHPDEVRADLAQAEAIRDELRRKTGLEAAEARSTRAWEALEGRGPIDPARYPQAHDSLERRTAPWARDADEKLVLTEADIEGWIRYASLCREVQAGGPLKLSINDREQLYKDMRVRFETVGRAEQIGMVGLGGFWGHIEDRWVAASYEEQQAWIQAAPLPPPMTASSMGYASVVFEGNLRQSAEILHDKLGPFTLD